MVEAWRILAEVGPRCQENILSLIRMRAERHRSTGFGFLKAQRKAMEDVLGEVTRLYRSGGAESVSHYFGYPS